MNEIFISHSSKDINLARMLSDALKQQGLDPWFDHEDLYAGANWEDEIRSGLEKCQHFVVIVTPNVVSSRWVPIEVAVAFDNNKPLLPLKFVDVDERQLPSALYLRLKQAQWTDFRASFPDGFNRLMASLQRRAVAPTPPPQPQPQEWRAIPGRWYVRFGHPSGFAGEGIFEFWAHGIYRSDLTSNTQGRGIVQGTWFFQPPGQLFLNGFFPNGMPFGVVFNFSQIAQTQMMSFLPDGTQYLWQRQAY